MEQTEKKTRVSILSRDQYLQLFREYAKTPNQSVKEFCGKHGINRFVFYYYRSRYQSPMQTAKKAVTSSFIAITAPVQKETSPPLFAEAKGIKIYQPVTAEYLKTLVS
ncbi:hypothetical protein Niako_3381 [Niastella koreensis GR20-10]|uniref:Transposase n=2 Tax=Niastella koreensis TaxID=354356 RepID=G8TJF3_NIAKG|nr:hypothetical protein [Niastella koreensis]AEV99688.1 hypothetical protein Niako_3381 [Niastella koreensis GR20-10]